eukprot:746038-Hanusia_phi.AAC.1
MKEVLSFSLQFKSSDSANQCCSHVMCNIHQWIKSVQFHFEVNSLSKEEFVLTAYNMLHNRAQQDVSLLVTSDELKRMSWREFQQLLLLMYRGHTDYHVQSNLMQQVNESNLLYIRRFQESYLDLCTSKIISAMDFSEQELMNHFLLGLKDDSIRRLLTTWKEENSGASWQELMKQAMSLVRGNVNLRELEACFSSTQDGGGKRRNRRKNPKSRGLQSEEDVGAPASAGEHLECVLCGRVGNHTRKCPARPANGARAAAAGVAGVGDELSDSRTKGPESGSSVPRGRSTPAPAPAPAPSPARARAAAPA